MPNTPRRYFLTYRDLKKHAPPSAALSAMPNTPRRYFLTYRNLKKHAPPSGKQLFENDQETSYLEVHELGKCVLRKIKPISRKRSKTLNNTIMMLVSLCAKSEVEARAETNIVCLRICNTGNFISRTKSVRNPHLRPGCTTIIFLQLMLCGDVETNRGPITASITADLCGTCHKVVKTGEKAL